MLLSDSLTNRQNMLGEDQISVQITPCPREILSSTLSVVPNTPALLKSCELPFSLIMTPFGIPFNGSPDESTGISFVPYTAEGPGIVRCKECRGYINPYVKLRAGGAEWVCNLCGTMNETPTSFMSWVDPATGERKGLADRPELRFGCVDMEAPPKKYLVRPPMAPTYIFFIDVSRPAITSGLVSTAVAGIKRWAERRIAEHPNGDNVRVVLMAFDAQPYIFTYSASGKPRMSVVPDPDFVRDAPPVFPDSAFLDLAEHGPDFLSLLDKLPAMFATNTVQDRAFARAIYAVGHICSASGGRLVIFLGGAPGICGVTGSGAIKSRQLSKSVDVKDEFRMSQPLSGANDYYKEFGRKLSTKQFAVDIVASSPGVHMEVATLALMARQTGGGVLMRNNLTADDVAGFIYGGGAHGWEAIMRTRYSKNLLVDNHYGTMAPRGAEVYGFPSIGSDNCLCANVLMNSPCTSPTVYVQNALVYTNESQRRMIRVSTLELPVAGSAADVFAHANAPELVTFYTKVCAQRLFTIKAPLDVRNSLTSVLCKTLLAYRRLATVKLAPRAGLTVPESLESLPLYILSAIKAQIFQERMRPDFRAAAAVTFQRFPMSALLAAIHPQLFDITDLAEGALPPLKTLTLGSVPADSIVLFHTGNGTMTLYVGKEARREKMMALFGTARYSDIEGLRKLPVLDESPYNVAVRWLVDTLAAPDGYPHLEVSSNNKILDLFLLDEHSHSTYGYTEFISFLYNKVEKEK